MKNFIRKFLNYTLRVFINYFVKNVWRFSHWFVFRAFYKNLGLTSYISYHTSVINRGNISIGKNVVINRNCILHPIELKINDNVSISPGTTIFGKVCIDSDVLIGPNVSIMGGNHNIDSVEMPIYLQGCTEKGIVIEKNVWIGSTVVILDGVTIGEGAVIGGGSVVTKNLPKFSISVGNPARVIKYRGDSLSQNIQ